MVHVCLAPRSTLTELAGEMFLSWSKWMTQTSWRYVFIQFSKYECMCVYVCVCVGGGRGEWVRSLASRPCCKVCGKFVVRHFEILLGNPPQCYATDMASVLIGLLVATICYEHSTSKIIFMGIRWPVAQRTMFICAVSRRVLYSIGHL